MNHWDDLKGHQQVREWFQRALDRERLSHAYLLAGAAGIGKKLFARKLAQALLCPHREPASLDACRNCPNCTRFDAGTHPDYHELGCPEGKREIPVESFVGDLEHRGRQGLCHELSLRPMAGDRKVAVIDDAHLLNRESGNSLLKTLEEPPARCLIVLITAQEDSLLPTIRSRCQLVRFPHLSEEDMRDLLSSQIEAVDEATIRHAIRLCNGDLEVARSLLSGNSAKLFVLIQHSFQQNLLNPLDLKAKISEVVEESSDAAAQREICFGLLRFVGEFLRGAGRSRFASPTEVARLRQLLPRLREAERQLHESMPISLWIQGFVDDFSRKYNVQSR
jgi:DNA polymerase III subunit delta'